MIEQVIQDYLRNNRRLVLPEFGAFLKKEEGAVLFVPFLNKDDGVLTGLVAQAYGATQAEARGIVSQYVAAMHAAIDGNGFYVIPGLGTLKPDANGILGLDVSFRPGVSSAPSPAAPVQPRPMTETPAAQKPAPATSPAVELPVEQTAKREPAAPVSAPPVPAPEHSASRPVVSEAPARPAQPATPAPTAAEPPQRTERPVRGERPASVARPVRASEHDETQPVQTSRPAPASEPAPERSERPAAHAAQPGRLARVFAGPDGKKPDVILIIAIAAAAIAIIVMLYGYFSESVPVFNLSGQTEQVQEAETPTEQQPAATPAPGN